MSEFLRVVFAKVTVGGGCLVEGEDVIGGLELGYGDEPDLCVVSMSTDGVVPLVFTMRAVGSASTYITAMGEGTDALLDRRQLRDESLGSRGIDAHFLGFTHFPRLFFALI